MKDDLMKILVCVSEYPPINSSGIGNVANEVVKELRIMGRDCTVCSPTGPDIKLGSSSMIKKFGIIGLLYYWYQLSRYFKKNNNDFDVVWLHNPLFLINNPFKKSLITIHSTYYGKMIKKLNPIVYYNISSKIERYCLNKINKIINFTGVSSQVCKELEYIGIAEKRIIYLPNGADTKRFHHITDKNNLRKIFGIPEDDIIILSLGRLTEVKKPKKLIEVFPLIEKEIKDVTLVIAGNGELLDVIKELIKQKKLEKVKLLGYVDNEKTAPNLYACSDYYIMTSEYEGQPLTLLEAMASGLPCIVSDIPNLKIVEDANCGIVVDFSDEEKAAQKILNYIKEDNSIHARNARKYAEDNLDWSIIAGKYLKEFETINNKYYD
ncbi:MAG: glycosyltransferase family 4 protein [Candidatus Methanoperedens sp.]|nr:glycosyltransferase family 4 protein [Candidatus Methanoperedens sp.]